MNTSTRTTPASISPWQRALALVCAVALVQLEWVALWHGLSPVRTAHAQMTANRVAVIVVPSGKGKRPAVEAEAVERILTSFAGRLKNVRRFDLSPLEGADQAREADELIEEALRALLLRTPKRAQDRLDKADRLLTKHANAGTARLYARLAKARGLTALARNELLEARDAVVASLVLFPNQSEDEYVAYGTAAKDLFVTSRGSYDALGRGDLVVEADSGADVFVNGQYRGAAPLTIPDLPAGKHRVLVGKSGKKATRAFVDITADKRTPLTVSLVEAPFELELYEGRAVLAKSFGQPSVVEDRIRELRNRIGADQLLVVQAKLRKKHTDLKGYFLSTDGAFNRVAERVKKDLEYLDSLGKFVATAVGTEIGPDPDLVPLDERKSVLVQSKGMKTSAAASAYIDPNAPLFAEEKKDERPLTSEWWFWAGVGAGALLLGGTIALLVRGEGDDASGANGTLSISLNKVGN